MRGKFRPLLGPGKNVLVTTTPRLRGRAYLLLGAV